MTHYRIVDWDKNYEVNTDNRAWQPGQPFRQGKIGYVRVTARRDWNHRLVMLRQLAGDDMWSVVGIFEKLCQTVACEPRDKREGGIVRYSDGEPATVEQIAKMLLWPVARTQAVLDVLCHEDVGWMHRCEPESATVAETGGNPPEPAETSGQTRSSLKGAYQVMSSQDNTGESSRIDYNTIKGQAENPPDSHDDFSLPVHDTTRHGLEARKRRLAVQMALHETLRVGPDENAARAIINFEKWIHRNVSSGRAGPEVYEQALAIARDCVNANTPFAAWMCRVQDEMGYQAPTKRKGSPV